MNKFEKIVYDIVKSNPRLKSMLRNVYQSIFDLIPDKKNYMIANINEKEGYFFGFHDVSPFSYDGKYILSNKLTIPLRMPTREDELIVGYWNNSLSKFIEIQRTKAWNYHKGCRLQWVGKERHCFIFNNVIEGKLCSTIYSIEDNTKNNIVCPIDTVSPNGKYATSFSYERLNKYMPGYGYEYSDNPYFEENDSDKTGLFLVDIENNTYKLIITLKNLATIKSDKTMNNAHHYVTHTEFSPDGKRIAFLHRWTHDDSEKRYTRLITCKLDGSDMYVSNTTGMVSHYVWDSEHGILAYCQVNGIDGHYIFNDYRMQEAIQVATCLNSDGHQTYIPKMNKFITDTYPDKRRYAKLYLCDLDSNKVKLIADLKSPKKFQSPTLYKHWSCDLHPRVSPDGKYVSFDSVHSGKRAFCIMNIENI